METSTASKKYCIAIDGSDYSDWAFNLVVDELYQKGDKVVVVHIANPGKEVPFAFQAKTIISKYEAKLTGKLTSLDYKIISENRENGSAHALAQVNKIAVANNCSVLVLGYYGHKLNKDTNELSKGIAYVLSDIKIPTIIVKENLKRSNKGSFTWLASIEEANSRSFKAFEFFTNYMNLTKDKIIGSHINSNNDSWAAEVKQYFEKSCENRGISNKSFMLCNYDKNLDVGTQITNQVNFNENEVIDFLIVGHNPRKNSAKSPLNIVLKSAQCNVLFYS